MTYLFNRAIFNSLLNTIHPLSHPEENIPQLSVTFHLWGHEAALQSYDKFNNEMERLKTLS
jgi:hypothetical protein